MLYLSRVILERPEGPQVVAFGSLVGALTIETCWWLPYDCSTFLEFSRLLPLLSQSFSSACISAAEAWGRRGHMGNDRTLTRGLKL